MAEPKAPKLSGLAAAMAGIAKSQAAAKAMEEAREKMGLMTNAAKKAAAESDKLNKANQRAAQASEKTASKEASAAVKAAEKRSAADVKAKVVAEKAAARTSAAAEKAAQKEQTRNAKWVADQTKKADAAVKTAQKAGIADAKMRAGILESNKAFDASSVSMSGAFDALKAAGPEGMALAVALQAITGAVLALTAAFAGLAAAAIHVVQQRAGLVATFGALAGGAIGGGKILGIVDKLSSKLPLARGELEGFAKEFAKAGLQGKAMEEAIKAAAGATALMGESGGKAVESLISTLAMGGAAAAQMVMKIKSGLPEGRAMLAEMGLRVEDLAGALGVSVQQFKRMNLTAKQTAQAVERALAVKAAGPLADMLLSFPVILSKLKEGFFSLFEKLGPAVKPFMRAVKDIFGQFTRGSGTMKTIQAVVTRVFSAIFAFGTKAVQALTVGFRKIIPAITAVMKFLAPIGAVGKSVFTSLVNTAKILWKALSPVAMLLGKIFTNATVLRGLQTIFKVIAVVIGVVVVIIGVLAATFGVVAGAIVGFFGVIIGSVATFAGAIGDALANIDPSAFIASMAKAAMAGLASFKQILGIASPSKVMQQMGGYVAEGASQGVDAGAGKVEASASKLGAGVAGGAAKGMSGGAKGGKGGASVTIQSGAIVINAGGATITEEGLALALERLLMSQGLGAT